MKVNPTYLAGALLGAILLSGLPLPKGGHVFLGVIALLLSIGLLVQLVMQQKSRGAGKPATAKPAEEPGRPAVSGASSAAQGSAEAEVIAFLGLMQDKGRLIDFLMDDISGYGDEEVGQAARVVYEGCRDVLRDHLTVEPLHGGEEGDRVTVPSGYRTADFQLSGKLQGEAPFEGTLVHRGWKVTSAKLPKVMQSEDGELPNLAPSQVEI